MENKDVSRVSRNQILASYITSLPEIVKSLRKAGQALIPIGPQKSPLISTWKPYQENPPSWADYGEWIESYGHIVHAWARITGKSYGFVVADFDREAAHLVDEWGLSPHIRSGNGGYHVVLAHPGWKVKTINSKTPREYDYPGLDMRGDGGYHIVWHARKNYEILRELTPDPITVLPFEAQEFFGLNAPPQKRIIDPNLVADRKSEVLPYEPLLKELVNEALKRVQSGQGRNNCGFWLACQLRDEGFTPEQCVEIGNMYCDVCPDYDTQGKFSPYTAANFADSVRQAFLQGPRESRMISNRIDIADEVLEELSSDRRYTDLGNSKIFVDQHKDKLRYCLDRGVWFLWTDTHWKSAKDQEIERYAKETAESFFLLDQPVSDTKEIVKIVKHAEKSQQVERICAMVKLAKSDPIVWITFAEMDANGWLANALNGTVDLQSGKFREHSAKDYLTRQLGVAYDPRASCPNWLQFLSVALDGDKALINFIGRALGYSLTSSVREKCLFFLHGPTDSGKSVFMNAVSEIFGDYWSSVSSETFTLRKNSDSRRDAVPMIGKRLITASETSDHTLDESFVKRLTGDDSNKARPLYEEEFDFRPIFKLWIAGNHKPAIVSQDAAIWNRIKLIPFGETIPPEKKDLSLPDRLRVEYPGIFNWMIHGCLEWQKMGLAVPTRIQEATEEYRNEQDAIGEFLSEHCEIDAGAEVRFSELYCRYDEWCSFSRISPLNRNRFSRILNDKRFVSKKGAKGIRAISGLRLK